MNIHSDVDVRRQESPAIRFELIAFGKAINTSKNCGAATKPKVMILPSRREHFYLGGWLNVQYMIPDNVDL
jgi:hypothetical protein